MDKINIFVLIICAIVQVSAGAYFFIYLPIFELRKDSKKEVVSSFLTSEVATIVAIVAGNIVLYFFQTEEEVVDPKYLFVIQTLYSLSIFAYIISKFYKQKIGPITIAILPLFLLQGIIFNIIMIIHVSPILIGLIVPLLGIFVFPAFSFISSIILFSFELHKLLQNNKNLIRESSSNKKIINWLIRAFFGENRLFYQIIFFPFFITILQFVFIVFTQKPDSALLAITESSSGVFSTGGCDNCTSPEYVCTIAAHGNEKLVKPTHLGSRDGTIIKVNRQLQICNAFEQFLQEKSPKIQKFLRARYDSMQISIEKWKNVTLVANILYVLIKPMEWFFLFILYTMDPKPENRIIKQYL